MRAVSVASLKAGDIVGRTVLDTSGRMLLREGVELNEQFISLLGRKGYKYLFLREPHDIFDVAPEEDLSPELRSEAFQTMKGTFDSIQRDVGELKSTSAKDVEKAFGSSSIKALMGHKGPLGKVQKVMETVVNQMLDQNLLAGLTSIKGTDTFLYDHSIDVAVVAVMIGRMINLDIMRIKQLAMGCMMHDIGMLFVKDVANEEQRIRLHTKLGYELLKASDAPDIMAPTVAYEHHEHQDGSGLPRGLRGSNAIERNRNLPPPIPTLIGEIAAVANYYDNLLSGVNRPALTPDQALAEVRRAQGNKLNKEIVTAFLRVTPVYPVGTEVVITSEECRGFTGVVAKVAVTQLDRPVIVLTRDSAGNSINPTQIELAKVPKIHIQARPFTQ